MITCAVILIATGAPMAGAPGDDPKVNLYRDDKGGIHCSWSESVTSAVTRKIRIDVPQRGSILATESIRDTSGSANAEVEVTLPTDPRTPYKIRIVTTPFTGVRIAGPVIPVGIEEMLRINGGNPSALKKVHDLLEAGGPLLASRDLLSGSEADPYAGFGIGKSAFSKPSAKSFTDPRSILPGDGRASSGDGGEPKKVPDLKSNDPKDPDASSHGFSSVESYEVRPDGSYSYSRRSFNQYQRMTVEATMPDGSVHTTVTQYFHGVEAGSIQIFATPERPAPDRNPDEGSKPKWEDPQILEMLAKFGQGMKPRVNPKDFSNPSKNPGKGGPEGKKGDVKKTPRGAGTDPRDDIQGANGGSRRGARWWAGCPKGWDGVGPPPRGH